MGKYRTGINFIEMLQVAFIVLKLCGVIKWGWLWVISPMWISILIVIILFIIVAIIGGKKND